MMGSNQCSITIRFGLPSFFNFFTITFYFTFSVTRIEFFLQTTFLEMNCQFSPVSSAIISCTLFSYKSYKSINDDTLFLRVFEH